MVTDRVRLLLCFIVLISVSACQESVPPSTPIMATETAVSPDTTAEASFPTPFDQTQAAEFEAQIDEEESAQAGRTINGRIVTAGGTQQPVPAVQLQLEPGGEFVAETIGDGRFSLAGLPFEETTVFADHFQFTIPAGDAPQLDLGDIEYPLIDPPLTLENYPPSQTPYHFENSSFWLVHMPEGQLMAFAPLSPTYADHVSVDECQFAWAEANQRFADPCSGDEWELNGRLNLERSTELWSNRNLDQYHLSVMDGQIFIQFDRLHQSLPVNEPPLAADSQFGVTMTVTTADFNPTTTNVTTLTQVDPIWDMNPISFPPQQALTYMTFPNSLFDDQGRTFAPVGGQGGLAVFDPGTGGMQQNYHLQWEPVATEANSVTATLTTDLSSIYRQVTIQPDWEDHQEADIWAVDIPLEIGHAVARITELEWINRTPDGRIRLRLTVVDESPEQLNLYCLHLDTEDPWQRTCANFAGELDYLVIVPAEEAVTLHLRAGVELVTPFQFALPVGLPEAAAYYVPALDSWLPYENPALGLALRYPPEPSRKPSIPDLASSRKGR